MEVTSDSRGFVTVGSRLPIEVSSVVPRVSDGSFEIGKAMYRIQRRLTRAIPVPRNSVGSAGFKV